MSVPTFIDIGVEDQCLELRAYFKSLGSDISAENSSEGLIIGLQQIIEACDICFKDATEAEIEAVLNDIVSILVMLPADECENLVFSFCEKLTKAPSNKIGSVCLRVLQNLYEGLTQTSPLRMDVYYSVIKVAGQTDSIQTVFTDLPKLKSLLVELNTPIDKIQRLLRLIHESLIESKQSELASKVMVELLGTYTEDNASQARDDAHKCIVTCLADPNAFLLDHLLPLKPVRFLEGELIHDLLTIFVSEKLSSYLAFYNLNKDFVASLGLSHEENMQKMRLLTFMQMAETAKELSFETIQQELQLGPDEVEGFVIDVLRTKLVQAKINQNAKKVIVTTTMHRTFGKQQWQHLKDVLVQWHGKLAQVENSMESVINAHFEQVAAPQA